MSKVDEQSGFIEIKNFELRYDGLYHITWFEEERKHEWHIYLSISQLLRLIEIEGFTIQDVMRSQSWLEDTPTPLKFEKAVLTYYRNNSLIEASFIDPPFYNSTLEKDGYTVEVFVGDSMEKYKNSRAIAGVALKDEIYDNMYQNACKRKK